MGKYILAHDLGTSGNKAALFDDEGKLVCSRTSAYKTVYLSGNRAEQSPDDWWNAVCSSSAEVLSEIDSSALAAVSFSGQMMACLCVDRQGRPLHDALIYSDQRSTKQEQELIDIFGMDGIYRITGNRPSSTYTLPKLIWIRENRPEIYSETFKVLQAKDYINYRLTGTYFTDYNDASGTNAFDLNKLCWSEDIFEKTGIPLSLFPEAVSSTHVTGTVSAAASAATGIPEGVPVVIGAGDGGCATLGAGSVSPGRPYCNMGSTAWVSATTEKPLDDPQMRAFTFAHPVEGLYQPCATMQSAGTAFSWFSSIISGKADAESLNKINGEVLSSPPGANGVIFLPYLIGERSPWWNSSAKGEFLGMNLNTSRGDMGRAVVEGIAMNLNLSLSLMTAVFGKGLSAEGAEPVMFMGGGARSEVWRRIFADVFGRNLTIPELLLEATSMGAALLGGVGTGVYGDFSMAEKMNPVAELVETDSSLRILYTELSDILVKSYKAVEPLFQDFDNFRDRF